MMFITWISQRMVNTICTDDNHIWLNKPYLVSNVLRRKKYKNMGCNLSPSSASVWPVMYLAIGRLDNNYCSTTEMRLYPGL